MGGSNDSQKDLLEVLFVEDDPADIRLLKEALNECDEWCHITTAHNGAQALDMLFQRGRYQTYRLPDLVLLDLNLPILTGHEVLTAMKANDRLGVIPVVVLSNSINPDDINKSYELGASCYIQKPREFDHLTRVCSALRDFWYGKATLPKVIAATSSG